MRTETVMLVYEPNQKFMKKNMELRLPGFNKVMD